MIHVYDPKTMTLPYAQEINQWINRLEEPLVHMEWDMEYAPEVYLRFMQHIKEAPDRIHVAPYLLNIYFEEGGTPVLFWAHRVLRNEIRQYRMEEKFKKLWPLKCPKCKYDFKETLNLTTRYPAWVAGGETDADLVSIGFWYIPRAYWNHIYPEIKDVDWRVLDISISAQMDHDHVKALIHWDCVVNHNPVKQRPMEASLLRKWVRIQREPLSEEEKAYLRSKGLPEQLPPYHGWIGESMYAEEASEKTATSTSSSPKASETGS